VRVGDSDSFMFDFGPTGRFVAGVEHGTVKAVTSLPGGNSAIPGSPCYVNLLEPWLRNETFPLQDPSTGVLSTQLYLPWTGDYTRRHRGWRGSAEGASDNRSR
jgi:acyl-homoserine lactone acylase PvdQ